MLLYEYARLLARLFLCHNVTVSTSGNHAHTFTFVKEYDAGGTEPGSASWRSNRGTKTTEQAGDVEFTDIYILPTGYESKAVVLIFCTS